MPENEGHNEGRDLDTGQNSGRNQDSGDEQNPNRKCSCPNCGFKIPLEMGIPCINKICPKCGIMMSEMK